MSKKSLLDVNVLVALIDSEHIHHESVVQWFESVRSEWGLCAFTEAGALRVLTNPKVGRYTIKEVSAAIENLALLPGYRYWRGMHAWTEIDPAIRERVLGHQQITDTYLLSLMVKENGVLVTLDKAIRYLAGERFQKHVLVIS